MTQGSDDDWGQSCTTVGTDDCCVAKTENERTAGAGACASTACTALVDSLTDANVDLIVTGMASCTGPHAGYYAHYSDPWVVKGRVKSVADSCGLTTAFTPPALDTCPGAVAAMDSDSNQQLWRFLNILLLCEARRAWKSVWVPFVVLWPTREYLFSRPALIFLGK